MKQSLLSVVSDRISQLAGPELGALSLEPGIEANLQPETQSLPAMKHVSPEEVRCTAPRGRGHRCWPG